MFKIGIGPMESKLFERRNAVKKITASLTLSYHIGNDDTEITAEGETQEEALEKLLQDVRGHVTFGVKLPGGVWLESEVADDLPEVPDGYRLFILYRCSHSHGEICDWRIFALPTNKDVRLVRRVDFPEASEQKVESYKAGDTVLKHSFLDSNSEYSYHFLPEEALEYSEGRWVQNSEAAYDY